MSKYEQVLQLIQSNNNIISQLYESDNSTEEVNVRYFWVIEAKTFFNAIATELTLYKNALDKCVTNEDRSSFKIKQMFSHMRSTIAHCLYFCLENEQKTIITSTANGVTTKIFDNIREIAKLLSYQILNDDKKYSLDSWKEKLDKDKHLVSVVGYPETPLETDVIEPIDIGILDLTTGEAIPQKFVRSPNTHIKPIKK